jgi:Skp family chaperone for outer membrane proteins
MAQTATKIGVIDIQRAAIESNDGITATEQLQSFYDERSTVLSQTEQRLAEAQTRLETQQRALSQSAIAQLQADITRLQTQLQRDAEDAELDFTAKNAELVNPIYERVQAVVLVYAEEQRFTLILPVESVVYAATATDITSEIIRRMNDALPEASPAAEEPGQPEQPEQPEESAPLPPADPQ